MLCSEATRRFLNTQHFVCYATFIMLLLSHGQLHALRFSLFKPNFIQFTTQQYSTAKHVQGCFNTKKSKPHCERIKGSREDSYS